MAKSPNSSFISSLKMNVFETLLKIKKDNSKPSTAISDRLSIPKPENASRTPKGDKGNFFSEKIDTETESIRHRSISKDTGHVPIHPLKHQPTSMPYKSPKPLNIQNLLLKKLTSPMSPSSEIDSDSFDSKCDIREMQIGKSRIVSNPFGNPPEQIFGSYGNLMVLYENEQKNRQYYESVYRKEKEETDRLRNSLESLQAHYDVEKSSNEIKIGRLLHEVKVLKTSNLELQNKVKQKRREDDQETDRMLRKSATKIAEDELENMDKEILLDKFKYLKLEYKELSKKLLKQADELFEKNQEIRRLQGQKTELFKEISVISQQKFELAALNEQVAYLLNTTRLLKDKLKLLAETYKTSVNCHHKDANKEADEVLRSIDSLNEMVELNLENIYEKKQKVSALLKNNSGAYLVNHLVNSLTEILSKS